MIATSAAPAGSSWCAAWPRPWRSVFRCSPSGSCHSCSRCRRSTRGPAHPRHSSPPIRATVAKIAGWLDPTLLRLALPSLLRRLDRPRPGSVDMVRADGRTPAGRIVASSARAPGPPQRARARALRFHRHLRGVRLAHVDEPRVALDDLRRLLLRGRHARGALRDGPADARAAVGRSARRPRGRGALLRARPPHAGLRDPVGLHGLLTGLPHLDRRHSRARSAGTSPAGITAGRGSSACSSSATSPSRSSFSSTTRSSVGPARSPGSRSGSSLSTGSTSTGSWEPARRRRRARWRAGSSSPRWPPSSGSAWRSARGGSAGAPRPRAAIRQWRISLGYDSS